MPEALRIAFIPSGPDSWKRPLYDSRPFLYGNNPVAVHIGQLGRGAARPQDFDGINFCLLAQAEVQTRVVRGLVAHPSFALIREPEIASGQADARSNCVAIRSGAD